ncbi:MAG: DUF3786 domain-containing protein, partial [Deltaproteobacteria bacterium]|nr:DUF3786 domain-containing protein [Deltaproteobacteria bacterium]
MSTGACGIDCDACGLNALGTCSTCGPGRSAEARRKIQAQEQILGAPCPILACAADRHIDHCSRDCASYPCAHFGSGPYPFSRAYLAMQERRRREPPPDRKPSGESMDVPPQHWDELAGRDIAILCRNAGARLKPPDGILLPFLKEYLLVDRGTQRLLRQDHAQWEPVEHPLLELICLVYLLNASPSPVTGEMVGVRELKNAHFFAGPHDLDVRPLVARFGRDPDGFRAAAERLEGQAVDLADAAYRLQAFPKVPLFY